MTVQKLCTLLQNLAHDGHSQKEVILLGGDKITEVTLYKDFIVLHHEYQPESE